PAPVGQADDDRGAQNDRQQLAAAAHRRHQPQPPPQPRQALPQRTPALRASLRQHVAPPAPQDPISNVKCPKSKEDGHRRVLVWSLWPWTLGIECSTITEPDGGR